ncbi:MAG: tRNA (guanosine(37)-N1)-methyltransferase TrmD [Candidatus Margulisbacteria bacterium GWF2_35_9]|nr:MAG: tRNA (guanosine(37)-N1)-methyltransferase TrmD [Candidatus Margulisbacteria bacterium GWF2_35_9]
MLNKIDILTLFPEVITPYLNESIIERAISSDKIRINTHNLRDYSTNKHNKIDNIPFGGSTGMVIQAEPTISAIKAICNKETHKILFSPKGQVITMDLLQNLLKKEHILLIAGHYEGFDHRIENFIDQTISIGDYVLTGGELPALTLTDALVRLIPDVLGNKNSASEDSFFSGLLDWNVFTRPRFFDTLNVPDVLLSGNHKKIEHWKKRSAIINTLCYRPDLLAKYRLNKMEKKILIDYFLKEECNEQDN